MTESIETLKHWKVLNPVKILSFLPDPFDNKLDFSFPWLEKDKWMAEAGAEVQGKIYHHTNIRISLSLG